VIAMRKKFVPWDAAEFLKTERDIALYLEAVMAENDPDLFKAALGDVARARGMAKIAKKAGLGRTSLYKALSKDGNPSYETVVKVLRAVGLRLYAKAA